MFKGFSANKLRKIFLTNQWFLPKIPRFAMRRKKSIGWPRKWRGGFLKSF